MIHRLNTDRSKHHLNLMLIPTILQGFELQVVSGISWGTTGLLGALGPEGAWVSRS